MEARGALAVCARQCRTAQALADRVTFLQGDLFTALASTPQAQPFDLILSNPPYIPSADIARLDPSVRDYEPHLALDGGPDGMNFHRQIFAGTEGRLTAVGRVFVEIQFDQGPAVRDLAGSFPHLAEPRILKDASGHERVVTARATTT